MTPVWWIWCHVGSEAWALPDASPSFAPSSHQQPRAERGKRRQPLDIARGLRHAEVAATTQAGPQGYTRDELFNVTLGNGSQLKVKAFATVLLANRRNPE